MAFAGKEIQVGLANLGDFHVNNYRIGPNLGQTLEGGVPRSALQFISFDINKSAQTPIHKEILWKFVIKKTLVLA